MPWQPGDRVGDLLLQEQLGRGGMGAVFRAEHLPTGSLRAVKCVVGADATSLLRFRREGEALAALEPHPSLVRVHSAGETDGRAYLVMELVEGETLSERVRRGPLTFDAAARLVADLARALEHVHARGICHRDVKPRNVVLTPDGVPKLVDFGLARVEGADSLTATGQIVGTPLYMAPEQAGGQPTDARTDVYGLGGLLYFALTGSAPFEGGPLVAVLHRITRVPVAPPSAVRPEVPARLDRICVRALAKAPEERFPSAEALAEALEKFREAPVGRRLWVVAGLFLCVVVSLLAVFADPSDDRPLPPTDVAATPSPSGTSVVTPAPARRPPASDEPNQILVHPRANRARFLSKGRVLTYSEKEVRVWNPVRQPTPVRVLTDGYRGLGVSADRERFALVRRSSPQVELYHASGARMGSVACDRKQKVRMVAFAGTTLIVAGDAAPRLYAAGEEPEQLEVPEPGVIRSLAVSPQRRWLAAAFVASRDRFGVHLWELRSPGSRRFKRTITVPTTPRVLLFTNRVLVIGTSVGQLFWIDPRGGVLHPLTANQSPEPKGPLYKRRAHRKVVDLALSSGRLFSAGGRRTPERCSVRTWDVATWTHQQSFLARPQGYSSFDVSPDGKQLLVVPHGSGPKHGAGQVEVWETARARRVSERN